MHRGGHPPPPPAVRPRDSHHMKIKREYIFLSNAQRSETRKANKSCTTVPDKIILRSIELQTHRGTTRKNQRNARITNTTPSKTNNSITWILRCLRDHHTTNPRVWIAQLRRRLGGRSNARLRDLPLRRRDDLSRGHAGQLAMRGRNRPIR